MTSGLLGPVTVKVESAEGMGAEKSRRSEAICEWGCEWG